MKHFFRSKIVSMVMMLVIAVFSTAPVLAAEGVD